MTGVCPECKTRHSVPGRRGSKVSNYQCPDCKVPLQGPNAGKKRAKHQDVLTGGIFVYQPGAPGSHVVLDRPMVLAPWDRAVKGTPTANEWRIMRRCEGKVFGPGCIVSRFDLTDDPYHWPRLVPAPDGFDPESVFVNEPIKQTKCRACGDLIVEPAPRPGVEWKPVRSTVSRRRILMPTNQGPHPANAAACPRCYPAAWPADVQARIRSEEAVW